MRKLNGLSLSLSLFISIIQLSICTNNFGMEYDRSVNHHKNRHFAQFNVCKENGDVAFASHKINVRTSFCGLICSHFIRILVVLFHFTYAAVVPSSHSQVVCFVIVHTFIFLHVHTTFNLCCISLCGKSGNYEELSWIRQLSSAVCVCVCMCVVYLLCAFIRLYFICNERFVIIWQKRELSKIESQLTTQHNMNAAHNETYGKRISVVGLRSQTFAIYIRVIPRVSVHVETEQWDRVREREREKRWDWV